MTTPRAPRAAIPAAFDTQQDTGAALKFITCGSVDDGKSTLIGRLLIDSRSVLQDQLDHVSKSGQADLALFTDGLSAEREQGITIDVAYRYFNTAQRKFIIGDTPGHEQYTRNMVTAASSADAAVVLVDATKLDWRNPGLALLAQTRRHTLLVHLLRVPSIIFAVNKLDALENAADATTGQAAQAFAHIQAALTAFAQAAGIEVHAIVPISALLGHNVVTPQPGWCGYSGLSLLQILEELPTTPAQLQAPFALPVQWVEKFSASSDTSQSRRIFWGRVATGSVQPGQRVVVKPSGQTASVAQVLSHTGKVSAGHAGHSIGLVLDRELDASRGDYLLALDAASDGVALPQFQTTQHLQATVAWLDDEPLVAGRTYLALHGHRWVKAKVQRIVSKLDVHNLAETAANDLPANGIGHIELLLQEPLPVLPFKVSRSLGAMVLVDTASHKTAGAVLIR